MLATKGDQADCLLELIILGANLGLVSNNRDSAVQLANRSAFGSSLADFFRQAITAGRKVCSSNLKVFSLLHFVAGIGNAELLHMILQHSTEDTESFRLLIDAEADVSEKSGYGQSVMSFLQNHSCSRATTWFEEMLLSSLISCKVTCYSEFRALHFAAQSGDLRAIVQLLEMGFPINSANDIGHSPLMLVANEGHADACKLLLQRGADCKLVNWRGETAIFLARKSNRFKEAAGVIFDYLARSHMLLGQELWKRFARHEGCAKA